MGRLVVSLLCQFIYAFSMLSTVWAKQRIPSTFVKGTFYPHPPGVVDPDKAEPKISGVIRDVIRRNSQRFLKVLFHVNHPYVDFETEDARYMTSRAKSKLNILASMFYGAYRVKIRVKKAWTDDVDKTDMLSLHYEGRALEIQSSDRNTYRLGRLAHKAAEAGFDFVWYKEYDHIHVSVRRDVCQQKLDLVLVVDHSGSIGVTGFRQTNAFLLRLIDFFNIGKDETHAAMIKFSTRASVVHHLKDPQSKQALKNKINRMRYEGGGTSTGGALELMTNTIFNEIYGMRKDVTIPKVGVLVTDGIPMEQCKVCNGRLISMFDTCRGNWRWCSWSQYSKFGREHMRRGIQVVKKRGITIFVVGVGPSIDEDVIAEMATAPFKDHYMKVDNYQDLSDFVDKIGSKSCDEGAQLDNCTEAATDLYGGSFKYFQFHMAGNVKKVTIEEKDLNGKSFMFVSCKEKNPGPLSDDTIKSTSAVSPRTVIWDVHQQKCPSNIVYIAIEGQEDKNRFKLTMWDSLFAEDVRNISVYENVPVGAVIPLSIGTKSNPDKFIYEIKDGDPQGMFSLNNCVLRTVKRLDRESTSSYQLIIVAKEIGNICHKGLFVLNVIVADIDDNVPAFASYTYATKVREMTPSGVPILQVTASDPDEGINAELQYHIRGNDFKINKDTGIVTTHAALDYETRNSYRLQLKVNDRGNPQKFGLATLIVNIINVNEKPFFVSPRCLAHDTCKFRTVEEQDAGTKVGEVIVAKDPDSTPCNLTYQITSFGDYFTIGNITGEIRTKKKIDREEEVDYRVEIKVSDCESYNGSHDKGSLFAIANVHIQAVDINDNSPQFENTSYSVDVLENLKTGTPLNIGINAFDPDEGNNGSIRYSIANNDGTFTVDATHGHLTLRKSLDRERQAKVNVVVRATDGGNPVPRFTDVDVAVTVLDINDNAPVFYGKTSFGILENVGPDVVVFKATVVDADEGSNAEVRYSMIKGDRTKFSVDTYGTVKSLRSLDRETQGYYQLTIKAYDLGTPSLSTTRDYAIMVEDVNDNSPTCGRSIYLKEIKENTRVNTQVIQITATDPDLGENGTLHYSLNGTDDTFVIHRLNGLVRLHKQLDYAKKSKYNLEVIVSDQGVPRRSCVCPLAISVQDTNDYKPVFMKDSYIGSVQENRVRRRKVLKMTATDEDTGTSGKVAYVITEQAPVADFSIDQDSGDVYVERTLDREVKDSYVVPVTAYDHGKPSRNSTCLLHITILDVNDNAPIIEGGLNAEIKENQDGGTKIQRVIANDADVGVNGELEYGLTGYGMEKFTIDNRGYVRTRQPLDREEDDEYNLTVTVHDKGKPQLHTNGTLHIKVLDLDDNCPVFDKALYTADVREDIGPKKVIVTVKATDRDIGTNAKIDYGLLEGGNNIFKVNEITGDITAVRRGQLDRYFKAQYNLKVSAGPRGCGYVNDTAGKEQVRTEYVHTDVKITVIGINFHAQASKTHHENITDSNMIEAARVDTTDVYQGHGGKNEFDQGSTKKLAALKAIRGKDNGKEKWG